MCKNKLNQQRETIENSYHNSLQVLNYPIITYKKCISQGNYPSYYVSSTQLSEQLICAKQNVPQSEKTGSEGIQQCTAPKAEIATHIFWTHIITFPQCLVTGLQP